MELGELVLICCVGEICALFLRCWGFYSRRENKREREGVLVRVFDGYYCKITRCSQVIRPYAFTMLLRGFL